MIDSRLSLVPTNPLRYKNKNQVMQIEEKMDLHIKANILEKTIDKQLIKNRYNGNKFEYSSAVHYKSVEPGSKNYARHFIGAESPLDIDMRRALSGGLASKNKQMPLEIKKIDQSDKSVKLNLLCSSQKFTKKLSKPNPYSRPYVDTNESKRQDKILLVQNQEKTTISKFQYEYLLKKQKEGNLSEFDRNQT